MPWSRAFAPHNIPAKAPLCSDLGQLPCYERENRTAHICPALAASSSEEGKLGLMYWLHPSGRMGLDHDRDNELERADGRMHSAQLWGQPRGEAAKEENKCLYHK